MSWRVGRIEQRVALLDLADIVETEVRVLEEMSGLRIDLEGVVVIELVDIQ